MGQPISSIIPCSIFREYPHLRGAAVSGHSHTWTDQGISPPAWGSLKYVPINVRHWRNIPTCVGQPIRRTTNMRSTREYPHLRGAAGFVRVIWRCFDGISPPAWGSRGYAFLHCDLLRNIPTCVGQPLHWKNQLPMHQEYPHLRGAANVNRSVSRRCVGISPPAWGSLTPYPSPRPSTGNIPTCVGQPRSAARSSRIRREYPHLRGAACIHAVCMTVFGGISPPAWGSQFH